MTPSFRPPQASDRVGLLIAAALMLAVVVLFGIMPAVMPARD